MTTVSSRPQAASASSAARAAARGRAWVRMAVSGGVCLLIHASADFLRWPRRRPATRLAGELRRHLETGDPHADRGAEARQEEHEQHARDAVAPPAFQAPDV